MGVFSLGVHFHNSIIWTASMLAFISISWRVRKLALYSEVVVIPEPLVENSVYFKDGKLYAVKFGVRTQVQVLEYVTDSTTNSITGVK